MSAGTATATSFRRGEDPLRADKLNLAFSERVARSGDTMDGFLTLFADPVQALHAVTKQYVDFRTNPSGGSFLPLIGGNVSGILNLVDPGGALQSQRNITLASPSSTNPANQPFELIHTFTGINLDPPTGMPPVLATSITNIFTAFNNGGAGMRGFQLQTRMDPGSYGGTFNGVYSTVTQNSPHPPGVITGTTIPFPWVANQDYPTAGVGVFNSLGQPYYVVTPGHSAASGPGPQGQGSAIIDGTVVWAYQGPGYPEYWAPGTNYLQRGVLVTNPNNGGMFRVETPGTSGAFPGPVRYRGAWSGVRVASTANVTSLSGTPIIDSVATAVNDRVLLKDQTAPASNGIYVVAAGAWTRSVETNTWPELPGGYTTVAAGSVNIGRTYQCTVAPGGTLETTPITFAQITLPNLTAIPDGSVVWSQKGIGNNATQYIGLIGNAQGAYNMGGRSYTESVGHQWGAVIGARLNPAATFYAENVGLEVDDNINGSVRKTVGIQIVKQGFQGQFTDVGLWINTTVNVNGVAPAVANPRYKNAVLISRAADVNSGYGISFETFGNFERQHMAGAIDMRMVLADGTTGPFGGGFVLRHLNGMLDQFGAWQMRYGSITPTASGLAIDVTNVELQSIAITSGGANWTVGDGWKATDGSFGTVQTVSGGAILTVAIVVPSQVPTSARPATVTLSPFNPESQFGALGSDPIPGTVGPTGDVIWATPATGTPTYAAPATPTLSLMPSGGATVFGGPVNAPVIATGGTTARTLADRAADVVNVLDYGAVGDGVTDDKTAIQNAITYARSFTPPKQVYFPMRTYLLASSIVILANTTKLTLRGDPGAMLMVGPTNASNPALVNMQTGCQDITLRDLVFDGNAANNTTNVFAMTASTTPSKGLRVERCTFQNCNGTALNIPGDAPISVNINAAANPGQAVLSFASLPATVKPGAYIVGNAFIDPDMYVIATTATTATLNRNLTDSALSGAAVTFTRAFTTSADQFYGDTVLACADTSGLSVGQTIYVPDPLNCIQTCTRITAITANVSVTIDKFLLYKLPSGTRVAAASGHAFVRIERCVFREIGQVLMTKGAKSYNTVGTQASGQPTLTLACAVLSGVQLAGVFPGQRTGTSPPAGVPANALIIDGPVVNTGPNTYTITLNANLTASVATGVAVPFQVSVGGNGYGVWQGWGAPFSQVSPKYIANHFEHTWAACVFAIGTKDALFEGNRYVQDQMEYRDPLIAPSPCLNVAASWGTRVVGDIGTGASGCGIEAEHAVDLNINGGKWSWNGGPGIQISSGHDISITGVLAANNGQWVNYPFVQDYEARFQMQTGIGIAGSATTSLAGTLSNLVISGVVCSDNQATPTQKYGLRMVNSTTVGVLANFCIGPVAGSGNSVALVDPVLAGKTPNAANDTAAATAGVQVGQWYRNGSVMMQRIA